VSKRHVTKTEFVDGVAVGGGVVVVDGVAAVDDVLDAAVAADAVGVGVAVGVDAVVDDVVDFDDSSGNLVYYGDFGSSFDIDAPGGSYSL